MRPRVGLTTQHTHKRCTYVGELPADVGRESSLLGLGAEVAKGAAHLGLHHLPLILGHLHRKDKTTRGSGRLSCVIYLRWEWRRVYLDLARHLAEVLAQPRGDHGQVHRRRRVLGILALLLHRHDNAALSASNWKGIGDVEVQGAGRPLFSPLLSSDMECGSLRSV